MTFSCGTMLFFFFVGARARIVRPSDARGRNPADPNFPPWAKPRESFAPLSSAAWRNSFRVPDASRARGRTGDPNLDFPVPPPLQRKLCSQQLPQCLQRASCAISFVLPLYDELAHCPGRHFHSQALSSRNLSPSAIPGKRASTTHPVVHVGHKVYDDPYRKMAISVRPLFHSGF